MRARESEIYREIRHKLISGVQKTYSVTIFEELKTRSERVNGIERGGTGRGRKEERGAECKE